MAGMKQVARIMANDNEQIESQLCSYIDDELSPDDRAEIERYLAQNPQYRKLVDDLRRTREVLQGVRREPAPPEIVEAVQGQIERSLLLSDSGGGSSIIARIGRLPQFMAAAAMILLAVGLAYIVVKMLPPMHPVEVAIPTRPGESAPPTLDGAPMTEPLAGPTRIARDALATDKAPKPEDARNESIVTPRDLQLAQRKLLTDPGIVLDRVARTVAREDDKGMFVVILDTQQPAEAGDLAARFLQNNQIAWLKQGEPSPTKLVQTKAEPTTAPSLDAATGQIAHQEITLKDAQTTQPSEYQGNSLAQGSIADGTDTVQPGKQTWAGGTDGDQEIIIARGVTVAQVAELTRYLNSRGPGNVRVYADASSLEFVEPRRRAKSPLSQSDNQTAPANTDGWVALGPTFGSETSDTKSPTKPPTEPPTKQPAPPSDGTAASTQPGTAEFDAKTLEQRASNQANSANAKKADDDRPIRRGDTLAIADPEGNHHWAVNEQGEIELPDGGYVRVEGMSRDSAREALRKALAPQRPGQPQPSMQPDSDAAGQGLPTTLPATRPDNAAQAKVDMVIVVRSAAPEPAQDMAKKPATQPTTQPAIMPMIPPPAEPATKPAEINPADFKPAD